MAGNKVDSAFKADVLQRLENQLEYLDETGAWPRMCEDSEVRRPRFVTAYTTSRHYGGAEEGGWWYDWHDCLESRPIPPCRPEDLRAVLASVVEEWSEAHEFHHQGDRFSVLGGSDLWITLEHYAGESQSDERPRYE